MSVHKHLFALWVCLIDCCSPSSAAVCQPEPVRWTVTGTQSQHQFKEHLEELIVSAFLYSVRDLISNVVKYNASNKTYLSKRAGHHPGVPQHSHHIIRALQPASVADTSAGYEQY